MKRLSIVGLLAVAVIGLSASLIEANFVQCPGGVPGGNCDGGSGFTTNETEVINGTPSIDIILGRDGNDIIFGGADNDAIDGDLGDDVIFGGLGSDGLWGLDGDDILFPGPDAPGFGQYVSGTGGNDIVNVFVGEVSECLVIFNQTGFDVVNLIGFGPYIGLEPFNPPGFGEGYFHIVDPIAGGDIFIYNNENNDSGTEVINGLLSPNLPIIQGGLPQEIQDCSATMPYDPLAGSAGDNLLP